MKKLSFVFAAMCMSVGFIFSQVPSNVAIVTETGKDQTATVDQFGILNVTHVEQSNMENTAVVTQTNQNLLYNNLSDVTQSGKKNLATVQQISNGTLTGANAIGQLKSVVDQSGDMNEALQVQGPHNQQGKSFVNIFQSGKKNYASQHQLKYGNEATIIQTGNDNVAMQAQDSKLLPEEEGSYNSAIIEQTGNGNMATQTQDGWANYAKAEQSGNGNTSVQEQKDYSWKSMAVVLQSGDANKANQSQLGSLNKASIKQESNVNMATQTQVVTGGNRTGVNYDPFNEAEICQKGNNFNVAEQYQESPGGDVVANYALICQDGAKNTASQIQTGGDNYSEILQSGFGSRATVVQTMIP
jgi:uncharacterized protein (DUF2141 family)